MGETKIKNNALGDLDSELAMTRKVLERLPEEHFGWKPHDKSFSLRDLATHVANLPTWQTLALTQDHIDVAAPPPNRDPLTSRAAILADFDKNVADLRKALEPADDDLLQEDWALKMGEQVISVQSKLAVMRQWGISHLVHHRAQLSLYLRLLDLPMPAIYGPSADEEPGA